MLITGGWGDGRLSSVEIFDPDNPSLSCQLPNMTVGRNSHAAVGRTVCGGYEEGLKTCETLENGQWQVSHGLDQYTAEHEMWQSPSQGVIILGGRFRRTSTERLSGNGTAFSLQHGTLYVGDFYLY